MSTPVLILGAASDIARAAARAYAAGGRPIVLAGRRPEALEATAADLRIRYGVAVQVRAFNVLATDHDAFLAALDPAPGTVVCAVGMLGEQKCSEADPTTADLVMRSNYNGPASALEAAARLMERRGGGVVVGIGSVAGDRGRASNYVYGSAKAGFDAYLSGLRNRLARKGVHVVTVKPGFVDTKMTAGMNLPKLLTASPERVARAIVAAEARGSDVVYVLPVWRVIMLVIRTLPERVFKRLSL